MFCFTIKPGSLKEVKLTPNSVLASVPFADFVWSARTRAGSVFVYGFRCPPTRTRITPRGSGRAAVQALTPGPRAPGFTHPPGTFTSGEESRCVCYLIPIVLGSSQAPHCALSSFLFASGPTGGQLSRPPLKIMPTKDGDCLCRL